MKTPLAHLPNLMQSEAFTEVSLRAFWDLMRQFSMAMKATFPDCDDVRDWNLYLTNVVADDSARQLSGVKKWCENMCLVLPKAKYGKAVHSITGVPPVIYHAIVYRDIDTAHSAFESLKSLNLPTKLRDPVMTAESRALFWNFFDELNRYAFAVTKLPIPAVPTSEEIAANIAKRREGSVDSTAAKTDPGAAEDVLRNSAIEAFKKLVRLCGHENSDVIEQKDVTRRLTTALKTTFKDATVGDGCRGRDPKAWKVLANTMPELAITKPPTDAHWELLDHAVALANMDDAIPQPLMKGIESVAGKLMQDIASGKASLETLDLEEIGKQVLGGVNAKDVSNFASNLDRIVPALQQLHKK